MWLGQLFDYKILSKIADAQKEAYRTASPFPHIILDNCVERELIEEANEAFPKPTDMKWWEYKNALETKLAQDQVDLMPNIFRRMLWEMNSGLFVRFLQTLTGIDGLIPDPHYRGGGLHQIERGGLLRIHCDYNHHKELNLHRRINALIYLNKDWKEEYGGHLELWDRSMTHCVQKILPIFNRMVIFNTTDGSFHGHPEPLACPEGWSRKSMALYYYTATRPDSELSEPHSTMYQLRPQDEVSDEIKELIRKRGQGRIS